MHMRRLTKFMVMIVVIATPTYSQERKFVTPPGQVVAIRAGKLFDSKSGNMLDNPIVLIKRDRITDAGAHLQIPREARVIDLTSATGMTRMIDAHLQVN